MWRRFRYLPFAVVALGFGFLVFADCSTKLDVRCSHVDGKPRCVRIRDGLFGSTHETYDGERLRGATAVVHSHKNSVSYGLAVLDRKGREIEIVSDVPQSAAVELAHLIADPTAPEMHFRHDPNPWRGLVGVALVIAAGVFVVLTWRDWNKVPPSPKPGPPKAIAISPKVARRRMIVIGAGIAAILLGAMTVGLVANRGTGRLSVACEYRCRFGGAECLPTGSYEMSLDPGAYTIEVWNPDAPTQWDAITVQVDDDKTTEYTCRPNAR